jgi:hypothetical protein
VNLQIETGFPPAVIVNAGISRGQLNQPPGPLARFGAVYFDELSAFTANGTRLLTDGVPPPMVEANGSVVAQPLRLGPNTFKIV